MPKDFMDIDLDVDNMIVEMTYKAFFEGFDL